jgi:hypothetical protein
VIGTGAYGRSGPDVLARHCGEHVEVTARFPDDAAAAAALSDGAAARRRFPRTPLMQAARAAALQLARDLAARAPAEVRQ